MREEMRVVVVTPHLIVGEGEIDVDDVRVGSEADTVELDGTQESSSITG